LNNLELHVEAVLTSRRLPCQMQAINNKSTKRTLFTAVTALQGMPARTSQDKAVCSSVRPSVCPSVKRVDCDKTKERSVPTFIKYERSYSLVF